MARGLVSGVLLAALSPASGIVVVHGPESTKPASPPACGAHRLLVDLEDTPLFDDGSNLWSCDPFQPHRAPHVGARERVLAHPTDPARGGPHPRGPTLHPAPTIHPAGTPMGSIVFALVDEERPDLGFTRIGRRL